MKLYFKWKWPREERLRRTVLRLASATDAKPLQSLSPHPALYEDVTLSPSMVSSIEGLAQEAGELGDSVKETVALAVDTLIREWLRTCYPDLDLSRFMLIDEVESVWQGAGHKPIRASLVIISVNEMTLICSPAEIQLGPNFQIDRILFHTELSYWRERLGLPNPSADTEED